MCKLRLYLASRSPRRHELLQQIGLRPRLAAVDVDETPVAGESPEGFVQRLARAKGRAGAGELTPADPSGIVLAADTAVVLGDEILGKPEDAADARRMLRRLRNREHRVMTGVFCMRSDDGSSVVGVDTTLVVFGDYTDETMESYIASGEPMDKAGAYGIQGRGALLARRIEGSWSNVVGLPLERLPEWWGEIRITISELEC